MFDTYNFTQKKINKVGFNVTDNDLDSNHGNNLIYNSVILNECIEYYLITKRHLNFFLKSRKCLKMSLKEKIN